MVEPLRPVKGGFLRPFGAGWFIREYLAGNGPEGSTKIDPARGAPQVDISYEYKETLSSRVLKKSLQVADLACRLW
jgi:hypothetical protein